MLKSLDTTIRQRYVATVSNNSINSSKNGFDGVRLPRLYMTVYTTDDEVKCKRRHINFYVSHAKLPATSLLTGLTHAFISSVSTSSNVDGWNAKVKSLATKRLSNNNATPRHHVHDTTATTSWTRSVDDGPGSAKRFSKRSVLAWCHSSASTSRYCAVIVLPIAVDLFVIDRALINPNDNPSQWPFFQTLFLFALILYGFPHERRFGHHSIGHRVLVYCLRVSYLVGKSI